MTANESPAALAPVDVAANLRARAKRADKESGGTVPSSYLRNIAAVVEQMAADLADTTWQRDVARMERDAALADLAAAREENARLRKDHTFYQLAMNTAGVDELRQRAEAAEADWEWLHSQAHELTWDRDGNRVLIRADNGKDYIGDNWRDLVTAARGEKA